MRFKEIYQIYRQYKENSKHVDILKLLQLNINGLPMKLCELKLIIDNHDHLKFEYKCTTEIITLSECESNRFKNLGHEYFIYQYDKIKITDKITTPYPIASIFYIYPKTEKNVEITFDSLFLTDSDSPIYDFPPSITSDELKLYTTELACLSNAKKDVKFDDNVFIWNHLIPKGSYSIASNNDEGILIIKYITVLYIFGGMTGIAYKNKIIANENIKKYDNSIEI